MWLFGLPLLSDLQIHNGNQLTGALPKFQRRPVVVGHAESIAEFKKDERLYKQDLPELAAFLVAAIPT